MSQTIEAIVEPSGLVRLLEGVRITSARRALVTLLDGPAPAAGKVPGTAAALLEFLAANRLPASARLSAAEIDAQIAAERNAWD